MKETNFAVQAKDLSISWGEDNVLNQLNFKLNEGEKLAIVGPSGSGKTTLLMAIAGFNRPDSGQICFDNDDVTTLPPHKRGVGMVFQNYALFPHMSVFDNIAFPLKLRKVSREEKHKRVSEALEKVQLLDFSHRGIDQLSGGQRQRVALARAFVFGPKILLMDEPLSALDKKLREEMQIELKQLHRELGVTTVYVTHDQREALTMSDRIAIINDGELIQTGTPREIYNTPSNQFVASFIGESSVVPLIKHKSGGLNYGEKDIGIQKSESNLKKWLLVIRPERLSLQLEKIKEKKNNIYFQGEVTELVYQGETAIVMIQLGDGHILTARVNTRVGDEIDKIKIGQSLSAFIDRKDMIVIPDEGSR